MNLEKMRIGHKPKGYDTERRKRSYWNRLDLVGHFFYFYHLRISVLETGHIHRCNINDFPVGNECIIEPIQGYAFQVASTLAAAIATALVAGKHTQSLNPRASVISTS